MEYRTNPVKAIRAFCLECSCHSTSEVKFCPCTDCPLYPFRLGKNPFRQKREMTEEERKAVGDRLREARKKFNDNVEEFEEDEDN